MPHGKVSPQTLSRFRLRALLGEPTQLVTAYKVLTLPGHWVMGLAVDQVSLAQLHQEVVELVDAKKGGRWDIDMGHALPDHQLWNTPDGGYVTTRGIGLWDSSVELHVLQEFGVIRYFTPVRPLVTYCPPPACQRQLEDHLRLLHGELQRECSRLKQEG